MQIVGHALEYNISKDENDIVIRDIGILYSNLCLIILLFSSCSSYAVSIWEEFSATPILWIMLTNKRPWSPVLMINRSTCKSFEHEKRIPT